MHDVVIVGIPVLAIFAGILSNRFNVKDLRAEMKDLRSEMRAERGNLRTELRDFRSEVLSRLNVIESDMRQFYHLTGELKGRIDAIEKRL